MDESNSPLTCRHCGGTDFKHGYVGDSGRFRPDGNWFTTYEVRAHVCLRCGIVILAVNRDELVALRAE
jgi:hypothetical protein